MSLMIQLYGELKQAQQGLVTHFTEELIGHNKLEMWSFLHEGWFFKSLVIQSPGNQDVHRKQLYAVSLGLYHYCKRRRTEPR
jgi:hypothetical protein